MAGLKYQSRPYPGASLKDQPRPRGVFSLLGPGVVFVPRARFLRAVFRRLVFLEKFVTFGQSAKFHNTFRGCSASVGSHPERRARTRMLDNGLFADIFDKGVRMSARAS